MEDKYYIPELSEFYVGFEYEEYNSYIKEWSTNVWKVEDFENTSVVYQLHEAFHDNRIRIKYLNKEDIESLGFETTGSLWFKKLQCATVNGTNFLDCSIRLWIDNELDIYVHYSKLEDPQLIFRGGIKNKSELKKVLDMIGVEYAEKEK